MSETGSAQERVPYRHPAGHCESVQCAACWNLTDLSKPLRGFGYCDCGQPAEGGDRCRRCRGE